MATAVIEPLQAGSSRTAQGWACYTKPPRYRRRIKCAVDEGDHEFQEQNPTDLNPNP
jgi:hypothetical protein